jgi:hypothetical protein
LLATIDDSRQVNTSMIIREQLKTDKCRLQAAEVPFCRTSMVGSSPEGLASRSGTAAMAPGAGIWSFSVQAS